MTTWRWLCSTPSTARGLPEGSGWNMAKKNNLSPRHRRAPEDASTQKQRARKKTASGGLAKRSAQTSLSRDEVTQVTPEWVGIRVEEPLVAVESAVEGDLSAASAASAAHHEYPRLLHGNALGLLIEKRFAEPSSPCRSYSDLERRSGISREALSRYVTTRADRRRSPAIDTLAAIADALHVGLEEICRAAAATAKDVALPPEEVQRSRGEVLFALVQTLSDAQFSAVVELLRQIHPVESSRR